MLWEARELPSRVYGWFAFATANILCEIPYAILFAVVYFVTWYFPVGFPSGASTSGYVFFIVLVYFVRSPSTQLSIVVYTKLGTMDCSIRFKLYDCCKYSPILPYHGSFDYR